MSATPKTVIKALGLLSLVAQQPGRSLAELSRDADLPAPTAHRLLRALVGDGLVRADPHNRYHLGSRCLVLGSRFLETVDVRTEARPGLERLVATTGETAHLGVPDGTEVVYVDKVETSHPVRMYSRIGGRSPMHSTAIGKALLAHGEESLVDRVISAGLECRTPNTITDPDRFRAELDRTRARGYAVDDIENEDGIRCVAAPIRVDRRVPIAAVSVSGPASRLTDPRLHEVAGTVIEVAREISRSLGFDDQEGEIA